MKVPRWSHWLRAYITGYWWHKCPICDYGFAAYEDHCFLDIGFFKAVPACEKCQGEADKRNKLFMKKFQNNDGHFLSVDQPNGGYFYVYPASDAWPEELWGKPIPQGAK